MGIGKMDTTREMKTGLNIGLAAAIAIFSFCPGGAFAEAEASRNLPQGCTAEGNTCGCPQEGDNGEKDDGTEDKGDENGGAQANDECIKVSVGIGRTTPWTGSMSCALKVFADNDSPLIFTANSLHAVLGGYTFRGYRVRHGYHSKLPQ